MSSECEKISFLCPEKYKSPVGNLILASDGESLTGLWIEDQKYFGATLEKHIIEENIPVFEEAKHWLDLYFAGKKPDFLPPLAPKGSEFRQLIWKYLLEIPYGETTTYGALAKKAAKELGKESMSAQAVGGAVGHNPIGIIIPCHRILGSDGSLTGYAGGIDAKIYLLKLEGIKKNDL